MAANSFAGCTLSALSSNSSGLKPSTTKLASVTSAEAEAVELARPSPVGVGASLHSPDGSSASFFFQKATGLLAVCFNPTPLKKYVRQIGSFTQVGMNVKKYLSCHQT